MKFLSALVISLIAITTFPVWAIHSFDFAYDYWGDGGGGRILQVFDDGERTYFQVDGLMPVIFLDQPSGLTFLPLKKEGILYSVPIVSDFFLAILGDYRIKIIHRAQRSALISAVFYPLVLKPKVLEAEIESNQKGWSFSAADQDLKNVVARWVHRMGYHLVWHVQGHYLIKTEGTLPGDGPSALRALLASFQNQLEPIDMRVYDEEKLIHVFSTSYSK